MITQLIHRVLHGFVVAVMTPCIPRCSAPLHGARRLGALLIPALLAAPIAAGAPAGVLGDPAFARSRLLGVPAVITAGTPFSATFRVHNDGAATASTRVLFEIPNGIVLAGPMPICFTRYDPAQRRMIYEGSMREGFDAGCTLELAAVPNGVSLASFALRIETPPERMASQLVSAEVRTPPTPPVVEFGSFGVTGAGLVVLAFLLFLSGLALVAGWKWVSSLGAGRRRNRRGSQEISTRSVANVLLGASVLWLSFFAVLAWDDLRVLSRFRETRCEVFDFAPAADPLFSLRYQHEGVDRHSLGFSTGSRLSYSDEELPRLYDAYAPGGQFACWVDPADPQRVVLLRGFGGVYLFALMPLLLGAAAYGMRRLK